MKLEDLESGIKTALKIPVAESQFTNVTPPPFVIYNVDGNPNVTADSRIAMRVNELSVLLCQMKKDKEMESKLEKFFEDNLIVYEKT